MGAAVFMAMATAMPELFTNLISTFIADSDLGLGAVIGSLMWNILGVAAVSSIATSKVYTKNDPKSCLFTLDFFLASQNGLGTNNKVISFFLCIR